MSAETIDRTVTDETPRQPDEVRHQFPDALGLPDGSLAGLTREQIDALVAEATRIARSVPRIPPPRWVKGNPDEEGNWNGPSGSLLNEDGKAKQWVTVSSAWSPDGGAVMWLDCKWDDSADISPAEARALAAHLLHVADCLDPDNVTNLHTTRRDDDEDGAPE